MEAAYSTGGPAGWSRWLGVEAWDSGKEAPEGWDGMHAAGLLCCAAETNTVKQLYSKEKKLLPETPSDHLQPSDRPTNIKT